MPQVRTTSAERREKIRLRSQAWRRAHGIPPRKPAQKPWIAEGISRSTWYRRSQKARQQASQAHVAIVLDRLAWLSCPPLRLSEHQLWHSRATWNYMKPFTALTNDMPQREWQ